MAFSIVCRAASGLPNASQVAAEIRDSEADRIETDSGQSPSSYTFVTGVKPIAVKHAITASKISTRRMAYAAAPNECVQVSGFSSLEVFDLVSGAVTAATINA